MRPVVQARVKLQDMGGVGISQIWNLPAPERVLHLADWKSAIQQIGNLRYFPSLMQPFPVVPLLVLVLE